MSKKIENRAQKKPRILTFDLLRGYFMLSIVLNHLQWYPNGYDLLAMRGSLLISAAEGFFLLSGIVLGIVRGRKLLEKPFRVAAILLLKRGVLLYVTSVILTFLFMIIGWWFFMDNPGLKPGIRPLDQPLDEVIMGVLSFKYLYGWADFLRLYAVFLLATPLVLWLLRKGLWYIVLAASIGVWLLFPWAYEESPRSGELLMILSWQLIFFSGFIIGFYWDKIVTRWQGFNKRTKSLLLYPVIALAAVTLLGNIMLEIMQLAGILPDGIKQWYGSLSPYFFKEELPIWRILLFFLWFSLGFYLFKRFESVIMKYVGWLLLPFGQNSLYVYIVHAFILFFVHLAMPPDTATNIAVNFVGATAIIALIHLALKKQFLFKVIPR